MKFLLICFILYQSYAYGAPEVKLKFYKNVKADYNVLNEIHDTVLNFKPIILRDLYKDMSAKDFEINDKVTKNAINMHLYSKTNHKLNNMLQSYKKNAIQKGLVKLQAIPKFIAAELQIKEEELPPINNFIIFFSNKAKQYFDKINQDDYKTDIDKEFLLLDTVHIFNDLIYNEEINLAHDMISKAHINITKDIIVNINKHIYNELIENKKDDMEYLCLKLNVCRPSLRFTDYISDIMRELLKLSDAKLTEILIKLSISIKHQSEIFQTILGESAAIEIGYKFEDTLFRDVSKIRKLFTIMRAYLAKRHLFNRHTDEEADKRRKALRILVDIIDKSFDINGDEIISIHFGLFSKNIANWSRGQNNDIQKVFKTFVDHVVEIMQCNLSYDAQLEIQALLDVLMKREDKDNKVYNYIFMDGSKFMRGEDIASKLSLLN